MMLRQKTIRIDLNAIVQFWATPVQGVANERRANNLFTTNGLPATRRFSSMRATLQRRPQNQNTLICKSIQTYLTISPGNSNQAFTVTNIY